MVSHSLDPSGKLGSSGTHYEGRLREMGDQKQRLFKGKTPGRELLVQQQVAVLADDVHQLADHRRGTGHSHALGVTPGAADRVVDLPGAWQDRLRAALTLLKV